MFVKKKRNRSGTTSVVVSEKCNHIYKEHITIGISSDELEIKQFVEQGKQWILDYKRKYLPELDLFGEEKHAQNNEQALVLQFLNHVENILLNGTELILERVFNQVGFNQIKDEIFRKLVQSRLSCPSSKSATVEYLKNHFDEDVNLSRIYRYLDKLNHSQQDKIQDISVLHTQQLLGGQIGVMFYDVTTLYFETDKEDEFRKTGFSKEGRHSNPQIILGLLVSINGYPLAYCIHEGNKYEGHTMLPVVKEFVQKYQLSDFVVVADAGLMTEQNLIEMENSGYQYIIGAKIKSEAKSIKQWIISQPKIDRQMVELEKEGGRRLLVGYTEDRDRKDAYNRQKGIKRLEKLYKRGTLTKEHINKRGYNKFLKIEQDIAISINYDKIAEDAQWDGLKGYLTNTKLPIEQVYTAYHNLWNVERAFRISKSKIEIRPMFHFTKKRIEAHICICFVALKVYKELERILKVNQINMSVDKVLNMAKTITTIQVKMPLNNQILSKTMIMQRHKKIETLFDENFWGTR
jgi:transposase